MVLNCKKSYKVNGDPPQKKKFWGKRKLFQAYNFFDPAR